MRIAQNMMDKMDNTPQGAPMTTESRSNMMGLGEMMATPNLTFSPEQFGASEATRMLASGGKVPGLDMAAPADMAAAMAKNQNDINILTAALVLEYLESEFYARIVAADAARPYLKGMVKTASQGLARDEATHAQVVADMISKLGGTPIAKPQFQFPANVFLSSVAFLQLSVELEENGVGAYLGAAPKVQNKTVLDFAASIYGNEARHTGVVRFLLGDQLAPRDLEHPRTIAEALNAAAPFIQGGLPPLPEGVMPAMKPGAMT